MSIGGDSADLQSFPVGVPVETTFSASFTDGFVYSTDDSSNDVEVMKWHVTEGVGATISTEGVLNTEEVAPDTTLTITASGKDPYTAAQDSIEVYVSDAEFVEGSALVSIDGNSADQQSFPAGIPVELTFSASFTDGFVYSTDDSSNDVKVMKWHVTEGVGATINTEGVLNTEEVAPDTTLTITATGEDPYTAAQDSIDVYVSNAKFVEGSALVSIDGNSSDQQSFPAGVPVELTFSASFTNGFVYSTDDSSNDVEVMRWHVTEGVGATINTEGVLNIDGVDPDTTLIITATGEDPYTAAQDSIEIVVLCSDLAGACIDTLDAGGDGTLFTSSPSKAYLDSIDGGSASDIKTENGSYGPAGEFYMFNWQSAVALCNKYNALGLQGRFNWRLTTKDELAYLVSDVAKGSMYDKFGWPVGRFYWSSDETTNTGREPGYKNFNLSGEGYNNQYDGNPTFQPDYVSCVSQLESL